MSNLAVKLDLLPSGKLLQIVGYRGKDSLEALEAVLTERWAARTAASFQEQTMSMLIKQSATKLFCAAGLWQRIEQNFPGQVVWTDGSKERLDFGMPDAETVKQFVGNLDSPWPPRPFQLKALLLMVRWRTMSMHIGTGGGKTFIFWLAARWLLAKDAERPILVVVPDKNLALQMYDDWSDYWQQEHIPLKTCIAMSGHHNEFTADEAQLLIGTPASLVKLGDKLQRFQWQLFDEGHRIKMPTIKIKLLKLLRQYQWRIAMSGSIPNDGPDLLQLETYIGPPMLKVTLRDLIDWGYATKIKIQPVVIHWPRALLNDWISLCYSPVVEWEDQPVELQKPLLDHKSRLYNKETEWLGEQKLRARIIAQIMLRSSQNGLWLCNRLAVQEELSEAFSWFVEKTGRQDQKFIVNQTVAGELRREWAKRADTSDHGHHFIATTETMGTGVSIKRLHQAAFVLVGKSYYQTLQNLGRYARQIAGKKEVIVYDFVDRMSLPASMGGYAKAGCYSWKHWLQRFRHYEAEGHPVLPAIDIKLPK